MIKPDSKINDDELMIGGEAVLIGIFFGRGEVCNRHLDSLEREESLRIG